MHYSSLLLRKKTILSCLLLLIVSTALLQAMPIMPVRAQVEEIYITPAVNPPAPGPSLGFKWNVTVWVKDYDNPNVFAWQVKITYNGVAAKINATRAWNAAFDPAYIFFGRGVVGTVPVIEANFILLGDSLLGGSAETTPPNPTKLGIIEFEILGAPAKYETLFTTLSIDSVDTFLLDEELNSRTPTLTGATYSWAWSAPTIKPYLEVTPALVQYGPDPPSSMGQEFDVNVSIMNLDSNWYLHNVTFSLSYNATIINATDTLTFNALWGSNNYIVTPGALNKLTVFAGTPNTNPSGNVLILTIKFRVMYQGVFPEVDESPLALGDIILWDTVEIIPTDPEIDGRVRIIGLQIMPIEVRFPPYTRGSNDFITSRLENFTLQVWLNDLTADKRLIGAQFRLKYNATLLKFLNVTEGTFLVQFNNTNTPPYTWFLWSNESDGVYGPNILVGIVLFPNATWQYHNFPFGSGILATIAFQGIYRGVYPPEMMNATLELVDILLLDDQYNPIATTPIDGHYGIWSYKSPNVAFTHSPSVVNATSPVVFNASDSFDFGLGHIANYTWDFGDGTNATVTDITVEHVYMLPGTYTVNLTVTDDDGQTNSTVRILEVFKLSSTLSMEIKPSTITFSQIATINGTISPKRATANVNIQYRLTGELGWRTLAIMVTDTQGRYTFTWTPTKETAELSDTFELRASWSGDEVTESAQATATLEVKMARSTLTINLNPSTLNVGSKVTISGTLSPMQSGNVNVSITYRLRGGVWLQLATVRTNSSSNYNYTWTTMEAGVYEVRTDFTGDANAGPAQSQIAALTVNKETSKVEIYVYPSKAIAGSNVSVYGKVSPTRQGVNVTIFYRRLNGPWLILTVVKTSNESRYSTTWKITEIGTYEVRASWQGDANALPSESSEKTFTVEAQPTEILLYIMITILIVTITIGIIAYYKKLKKHKPQPSELIQP